MEEIQPDFGSLSLATSEPFLLLRVHRVLSTVPDKREEGTSTPMLNTTPPSHIISLPTYKLSADCVVIVLVEIEGPPCSRRYSRS
jgi:hypothetical protein